MRCFSLGGLETNLNFGLRRALVVLESCAYCPEKQDAGERESVNQPLWLVFRCKSMDLGLSLVELLVPC